MGIYKEIHFKKEHNVIIREIKKEGYVEWFIYIVNEI